MKIIVFNWLLDLFIIQQIYFYRYSNFRLYNFFITLNLAYNIRYIIDTS